MENDTANDIQLLRKQRIDLLRLSRKVWISRKLILMICFIGTIVGMVIGFSIPKEYTASTLIAPESTRRNTSSDMGALANITNINSSFTIGREAIYPSLYPDVIHSTPFLIQLFDIKVQERKDSDIIPLSRYIKERQKTPWWSAVTSMPSRLMGWMIYLFKEKPKEEKVKSKSKIDLFRLTREEAGIAGAIASRIKIGVDKKKRTIAILVTMQDPLVAANVADTVRIYLEQFITEYRTSKARKILEYNEKLCKEAQTEYYAAQDKYTRYADANQSLALLTSRAELSRLRSEMNLAYSTYNQMEIQVQAAKARVDKVTPVYTVIQPVTVPLSPSKPRIVLILAGCILLSAAGSIGWILFVKDFVRKIKTRIMMPVG